MPNFKSISLKMAVLQGAGGICPPPPVCVIQKTPCGIGLKHIQIPSDISFGLYLREASSFLIWLRLGKKILKKRCF